MLIRKYLEIIKLLEWSGDFDGEYAVNGRAYQEVGLRMHLIAKAKEKAAENAKPHQESKTGRKKTGAA